MNVKLNWKSIGLSFTALLTAMLLIVFVGAQTHAEEGSADVLKVTPVRSDITVKPGKSKTVKITVTNPTKQTILIDPSENDFIASGEDGTPSLILDNDKYAPTHSLKRFMEPLKSVALKGGESKDIKLKINVPKDAQAGGYFGAVRFAPSSPDTGGQVNLSTSLASMVLLTVPGDLVEELDLTNFQVTQNGESKTYFSDGKNMEASFRFTNKGNVQVGPIGKITVKKGDKVVYQTDFNNDTPRDLTLPDSARKWSVPITGVDGFGKYQVLGTFSYGSSNKTVEVSSSFWVIPPMVMIIAGVVVLLIVVAIIVLWLVLRNRKYRKYRK